MKVTLTRLPILYQLQKRGTWERVSWSRNSFTVEHRSTDQKFSPEGEIKICATTMPWRNSAHHPSAVSHNVNLYYCTFDFIWIALITLIWFTSSLFPLPCCKYFTTKYIHICLFFSICSYNHICLIDMFF